MMIPTAMSTTLPRIANSLNSLNTGASFSTQSAACQLYNSGDVCARETSEEPWQR